MSLFNRLQQFRRRIARGVFGGESNEHDSRAADGGETATEDETSEPTLGPDGVTPEDLESPADALTELGLTPEEFVIHLLEERDGRLRQQAFSDYTNWSEGTVSRLLQELEEEGHIVRVQLGREKLVCLPGHSPVRDSASSTESEDPSSA